MTRFVWVRASFLPLVPTIHVFFIFLPVDKQAPYQIEDCRTSVFLHHDEVGMNEFIHDTPGEAIQLGDGVPIDILHLLERFFQLSRPHGLDTVEDFRDEGIAVQAY
jgi:hypothetical protein